MDVVDLDVRHLILLRKIQFYRRILYTNFINWSAVTHDEVEQMIGSICIKQDVPVGPSANLAGEGDWQAVIAFYRVAFQQPSH